MIVLKTLLKKLPESCAKCPITECNCTRYYPTCPLRKIPDNAVDLIAELLYEAQEAQYDGWEWDVLDRQEKGAELAKKLGVGE